MAQLEDILRSFVIDNFLFGEPDGLSDDTSFVGSGIIDSTGMLELIGFLERQFGVKLLDEEIVPENLDSIRRLSGFVERKLKQGAEAVPCMQAFSN